MDKVSYLKGLLAGLDVNSESREGKVFYAICEALEESAKYTEELENRVAELEELCNILDEDLGLVEEMLEDNTNAFSCTNCGSQSLQCDFIDEDDEEDEVDEIDADEPVADKPEELSDVLDEDLGHAEEITEDKSVEVAEEPEDFVEEIKTTDNKNADETEAIANDADTEAENDTDDFMDDEEEYETICPTCGHYILLDERMLEEGETICPNCGEELEFDFDEEEIEKLAPADEK
ncbi:MAG: hypothetical protein K2G88_08200 [Oscillospiraceae bacterium]|nr:hypothetical protein [Oscillospiraceae bacterium]